MSSWIISDCRLLCHLPMPVSFTCARWAFDEISGLIPSFCSLQLWVSYPVSIWNSYGPSDCSCWLHPLFWYDACWQISFQPVDRSAPSGNPCNMTWMMCVKGFQWMLIVGPLPEFNLLHILSSTHTHTCASVIFMKDELTLVVVSCGRDNKKL